MLAPSAAVPLATQLWVALWALEVVQLPRHQPKPGQRQALGLAGAFGPTYL